jgi:signal transduction histidine kinase
MAVGVGSLVLRYLNGSALTSSLEGADYLGEILWWDVLVPAAIPAYATIGAVVASRRPRNPVGWLCLALGLLVAAVEAGWEYTARAFEVTPGGASLPLELPVAWVSHVLNPLLPVPFVLMLLLFPEGQVPSRRWRPVVWAVAAGACLTALSGAFDPIIGVGFETDLSNPAGIGALGGFAGFVDAAWFPALAVLLLLSIISVFSRWRGARDAERQQLKWLAYVGVVVGTAVVCGIASAVASGTSYPTVLFFGVGIFGVTVGVPLAIGTAVLRYRLYDVDFVINRTLVYGALTAAIIGTYVLVVGYLGATFRTGGNLAISLIATGIVAVLFQPMRDRLQRAANRLVYGERDDPYAVLSRLGRRLEATLAPEATLEAIVETVAEALMLPYAGVALRRGESFETAAEHGEPVEEPLVLPLTYGPETVGQLVLAPRGPGESFTKSDLRLLEDLARQVGIAAHAVRLTADLRRSRERLVTAREEERRRLRRDLHDGVGPQLAALTLKLETARRKLAADPDADALLSDLGDRARAAVADIRRAVYALRPPALDEFGLVPVLRETAAQYGQNGPSIRVEAPENLPPLPAAVEVAAYRIAGEALTNVVRHAEARTCVVRITLDEGAMRLEVSDDGVGIGRENRGAGVGLRSIRERAEELGGACTVEPGSGGGTRVSARLPLEASGYRHQVSGKSKDPVPEAPRLRTRSFGDDPGNTENEVIKPTRSLKPDA